MFLFKGSDKRLIREIEARNNPPDDAGNHDIVLIGDFDGRRTLFLRVALNELKVRI